MNCPGSKAPGAGGLKADQVVTGNQVHGGVRVEPGTLRWRLDQPQRPGGLGIRGSTRPDADV